VVHRFQEVRVEASVAGGVGFQLDPERGGLSIDGG